MPFLIRIVIHNDELTELQRRAPELDNIICDLVSQDIQDGARINAPVRTGFMRDNIRRYPEGRRFRVIAEAEYSGFVEYGTRRMAAQPYMTPAVEGADYDGACQTALARTGFL